MGEAKSPNVSVEILERLKSLDSLPHFPETLMKLDRIIDRDEDVTVEQVVDLVAQDARLVAGLIKLANSAKYSMGQEIHDLSEAVVRIGFKELGNLAYAIHFQGAIHRKPPFSDVHYLKHSLRSAFLAEKLAKRLSVDEGAAFLAALMRDIGIYMLAIDDREKYMEVIKLTGYNINKLAAAENHVFGTYHALMSARLLQDWKFPNPVIMGVAFHHTPEKANDVFKPMAHITFLAEYGIFRLGFDNGVADIPDEEREEASDALKASLAFFDLPLQEYDEIIQTAAKDMEEMHF